MPRIILTAFIAFSIVYSSFAQDCTTLTLSLVSKTNYNGSNISCAGSADGAFEVSASGGTGTYFYSLDGSAGSTSGIFSALPAGNYTVTVRDNASCEKQLSVNLTQPPALLGVSVITSDYNGQHLSCSGATDGEITATATGGTVPYTYSLDQSPTNTTGTTTGIFTNLAAGMYTIKVTDNNGCVFTTMPVILNSPILLAATSAKTNDVSCHGANDANIMVIAIGGTAPYSYTFNQIPSNTGGATSGVFTGIPAGAGYTFSVRDLNNCVATTAPLEVIEPSMLTVTASIISNYNGTNISCAGSQDAILAAAANGGSSQYVFQLKKDNQLINQNTTGIFNSLGANTYSVTVIDNNSCVSTSAPISIIQPAVVTALASFDNGTNENCDDASISVTASGGVAAYVFELGTNTTGTNTGVFTGLINGTYSVKVRDMNNCTFIVPSIEINQPSNISVTAIVQHISCFGTTDGKITAVATGGTGYQYSLQQAPSNVTGSASGIFTGLPGGSYTVNVIDQNNCEATPSTVVITSPTQITAEISVSSDYNGTDIRCFGAMDGEITVQAQGGAGELYSYTLSPLMSPIITSSNAIFSGLGEGTYSVDIKDGNGCELTTSTVSLTQPEELTLESTIIGTHTNEGSVLLTVVGGTEPYAFLWSNESTQEDLVNVGHGEYTVEITDANDCPLSESFIVPLLVGLPETNETRVKILYDSYSGNPYLSCTINTPALVAIDLHDLKGIKAYSASGRQEAGVHQYNIPTQLAPGVYIAKIRVNEKIHTRKFIVY